MYRYVIVWFHKLVCNDCSLLHRFHNCLQEALQTAHMESSSETSRCLADADPAKDTVITVLKSDRANIAAASEHDCKSPADTLAAVEQALDCTAVLSISDLFQ